VAAPVEAKRSRKLYVYWGIALVLLLVTGVLCWTMVVPVLGVRNVVITSHEMDTGEKFVLSQTEGNPPELASKEAAALIERLGGPRRASQRLDAYLRLPAWVASHREEAIYLLCFCGAWGDPVIERARKHEDPRVRQTAVALSREPRK